MKCNPIKINELKENLPERLDLVICCASFEKRCESLIYYLNREINCSNFLIVYNSNEYKEINDKAKFLNSIVLNSELIELDSDNPLSNALIFKMILNRVIYEKNINNIFLDITTFTHESLLIIFKLLYERKTSYTNLWLGYVGAKEYSTNVPNVDEKWLTSGISSIRSIIGFPGVISPARKSHLIVLFGFELERAELLITDLQFDRISLGFGDKELSIRNEHQELNHKRYLKLIEKFPNAEQFCFNLVDIESAKKDIENQISKYPEDNIVIAPLNNKISTLGAGLVAINNPRIQLIYAKPIIYNIEGYSEADNNTYLFSI